jgi:heptosyltransferase I
MKGTGNPKILIVKLSAIGDVVHALPALNALRTRFPRAWITWLVEEAAAPLILGHPALDRVLISRRKQWTKGLKTPAWRENLTAMGDFVRRLRDTPYDMIIDLQASLKGAALILLARGRKKIGYGPGMTHQEESFRVLNRRIPMISMEVHALDRNLRLLEAIGVPCREISYRLPVSPADRRHARRLLMEAGKNTNGPAVAINPVAKWESKLWIENRFARVADQLVERYGAAVCFTGAGEDIPVIDRIQSMMRHRSANLAGRTSLLELAALYGQVDCVISTDTGPMHIAAAAEAPVVAIFGPTAPWRTGPHGSKHQVLQADLPCVPCFRRHCPDCPCMAAVTVDDVLNALHRVLETRKKEEG